VPSHVYPQPGTYTVTLTVSDGEASANATVTLTVNQQTTTNPIDPDDDIINVGVAFSASPLTPVPGQAVVFSSRISNPGGVGISSYRWDFGDGGVALGSSTSHAYVNAGSYLARLTVITTQGYSYSASSWIKVSSPATGGGGSGSGQVAGESNSANNSDGAISIDAGADMVVNQNELVSFLAKVTGPSGVDLTYTWEFGDNSDKLVKHTSPTAVHIYKEIGTYEVTVTVEGYDDVGLISDSLTVKVLEAPAVIGQTVDVSDNTPASGRSDTDTTYTEPGIWGYSYSSILLCCILPLLILLGIAAYWYWQKRKQQKAAELETESEMELPVFTTTPASLAESVAEEDEYKYLQK
jgi:PKD repeat protein